MSHEVTALFYGALCGLGHALLMIAAFVIVDRIAGRPFFIEPAGEKTRNPHHG